MLKIDEFFDLSQTAFAPYFDSLRYPWDILKSLPEIAASFKQYAEPVSGV